MALGKTNGFVDVQTELAQTHSYIVLDGGGEHT